MAWSTLEEFKQHTYTPESIETNFWMLSPDDQNTLVSELIEKWNDFPPESRPKLIPTFIKCKVGRTFVLEVFREKAVELMTKMIAFGMTREEAAEFMRHWSFDAEKEFNSPETDSAPGGDPGTERSRTS